MSMPCRIEDESIQNPWESERSPPDRTLDTLTIAELMGEDHDVWIGKNKEFGYILEIETTEGEVINERCIHPAAAKSLADFCRRYLTFFEKLDAA